MVFYVGLSILASVLVFLLAPKTRVSSVLTTLSSTFTLLERVDDDDQFLFGYALSRSSIALLPSLHGDTSRTNSELGYRFGSDRMCLSRNPPIVRIFVTLRVLVALVSRQWLHIKQIWSV